MAYAPTSCADVVDAEGLDDGADGEERTEGKRENGTFNNDIKERHGCENTENDARLYFTLSQMWCGHTWECGDDAPKCSHEKNSGPPRGSAQVYPVPVCSEGCVKGGVDGN